MGRAGVQPHHGGRVHSPPPLPRHRRTGAGAQAGQPHPARPARRRLLGTVLRRTRRPQHVHRVLLCPEAHRRPCRRASHGEGPRVHPVPRRRARLARPDQDLARPLRPVGLGRRPRHAAGADAAALLLPHQHLRVLHVEPGHDCADSGHHRPQARVPHPGGGPHRRTVPRRAGPGGLPPAASPARRELAGPLLGRRPDPAPLRASALEAAPEPGHPPRRGVDSRTPGGRRLVGRHPTPVGLLPRRAQAAGPRPALRRHRQGATRLPGLHGRRRRHAAGAGLRLARMGHLPGHDRDGGLRPPPGPPRPPAGRALAAAAADPAPAATGR